MHFPGKTDSYPKYVFYICHFHCWMVDLILFENGSDWLASVIAFDHCWHTVFSCWCYIINVLPEENAKSSVLKKVSPIAIKCIRLLAPMQCTVLIFFHRSSTYVFVLPHVTAFSHLSILFTCFFPSKSQRAGAYLHQSMYKSLGTPRSQGSENVNFFNEWYAFNF